MAISNYAYLYCASILQKCWMRRLRHCYLAQVNKDLMKQLPNQVDKLQGKSLNNASTIHTCPPILPLAKLLPVCLCI